LEQAPELRQQCRELVMRAVPALQDFYRLRALQHDFFQIIDAVYQQASPGLQQTIDAERKHLLRFMKKLKQSQ
ncbi:MAG: hypothetical protein MUF25_21400, partial [Pirellulaceae bacterium]|nr:hypothetical protein [Pirellulaceae bacterium]